MPRSGDRRDVADFVRRTGLHSAQIPSHPWLTGSFGLLTLRVAYALAERAASAPTAGVAVPVDGKALPVLSIFCAKRPSGSGGPYSVFPRTVCLTNLSEFFTKCTGHSHTLRVMRISWNDWIVWPKL